MTRHSEDRKIFRILFQMLMTGGLLLLSGCSSIPPLSGQSLNRSVMQGDFPRSLAVLPFRDLTGTEGIAKLVRISFYNHLSSLPYRDVELQMVDLRLREKGLETHNAISKVSVKELGKILGCDAVIFGTVYEFQRIFAGFYSSMNVGASVNIWDSRTGNKIWGGRYTARSHEGGIPITLLDIPMITVRSGLNLTDDVKLQAVEELTRYLTGNIPRPGVFRISRHKTLAYELQAGAFFESERAARFQEALQVRGFPAFIRRNTDEGGEL
ncbi:MAG: GNA1162 family protein, partial [Desulfococcaceae bacterium]